MGVIAGNPEHFQKFWRSEEREREARRNRDRGREGRSR